VGDAYALVSIGLVSFAAAAQFAPVMLAGIYWRGGTRRGAIAGLSVGFAVWVYTLLLPSFARSGWMAQSFLADGTFGLEVFRPYALFGLDGLDPISHTMFWSMVLNAGTFLLVSFLDRSSNIERTQATLFVEVFRQDGRAEAPAGAWRGSALVRDLRILAEKFVGKERTESVFSRHAEERGIVLEPSAYGDASLVQVVERLIAGSIGGASARVTIASAVKGEGVSPDEVMSLLDETTHVLEYSRQLEKKSEALESATRNLQEANERLMELDRLKDEFLSTVTHELRTPLTSIRSFSEILHDDPDLPAEQHNEFLEIIISESERLTRLINDVLELAKIQAGRMQWNMQKVDMKEIVESSVASLSRIFKQAEIALEAELPNSVPLVYADRDRLVQVVINLLSNAQKFCKPTIGRVKVVLKCTQTELVTHICDNGRGIPKADCEAIFDRFHQVREGQTGNPLGTGLGLAICQRIVDHMGGRIWVESIEGEGADFIFAIPHSKTAEQVT
jgi:signal transduction histidine kinase